MNHNVNNVQKLHDDAVWMNDKIVMNGENSADSILNNLSRGVENLKNNWKGKDAGIRIQEVIRVHNAMASVRDALASLASDSSAVAANYRRIQNANGAGLEELSAIPYDQSAVTRLGDYSDTADTININPSAEAGKNLIDAANSSIEVFESEVKTRYTEIMENWTAGTGRDKAQSAFDSFIANVAQYKQTLSEVSSNITVALQNYTF